MEPRKYVYELRADTEKSGGRPFGVNEHGGPATREHIEARVKVFFPDAVFEPARSYDYDAPFRIEAGGILRDVEPEDVVLIFANAAERDHGDGTAEPGESRIGEMAFWDHL